MRTAIFESFDVAHRGWAACLDHPRAVHVAHRFEEVLPALGKAEEAAQRSHWAVVMLSYEAAPAFDPALVAHSPGEFPLAWCAGKNPCDMS